MFYCGFKCNDELRRWSQIGEPYISYVGLISGTLTDTIYLIHKRWGLTGDHEIYSLSLREPKKNEWYPNHEIDCIWEGEVTIFYQHANDKIKIYATDLPKVIPEFYTNHNIEFKLIDASDKQYYSNRIDSSIYRLR